MRVVMRDWLKCPQEKFIIHPVLDKTDENGETDVKNGENDENGGLHKRVTVLDSMFGKVLLPSQDNARRVMMTLTKLW